MITPKNVDPKTFEENVKLEIMSKKDFVNLIDKQPKNYHQVITDIREHAEFFAKLDKVMTLLCLQGLLSDDNASNFKLINEKLELPLTPKNIALIKSAIRDLN